MLKTLLIQNVALIAAQDIEFGPGLNVLTGETGAGKSIIIGSLNFILGAKLEKSVIRQGAPMARVDAVFDVKGAERAKITEISGVDAPEPEVILTRTIKPTSSGECRVNGTIVTADTLRAVAAVLINIHGQHDTEILLKPKNHVAILDTFGGQKVRAAANEYHDELNRLNEIKKRLKAFGGDDFERKRLLDMYQYQIKDIESAKLRDGEDEKLAERRAKMMNFEKLSAGLANAVATFGEGDDGIDGSMRSLLGTLSAIANVDARSEKFCETARSIKIELDDLCGDIQSYLDDLEFDPEEFKRVDARLDEIKILKRKYGSTIPAIFAFLNDARAGYDLLTRSEEEIEKIKSDIATQETVVANTGNALVEARLVAARDLESKLLPHLADLGMPRAQFRVDDVTVDGVNFLFSANAGQDVRPLVHIISGGEMSRFMLALKAVTANIDGVDTLVFDEIDTGISGTMGHKIAEKIATICKFHQVIAVTHLAQIAAVAHHHHLITKEEVGGKTITSVTKLTDSAVKGELSRMVGGEEFVKKITK